jgi:predicted nucleotide-binding protein
LAILGCSHRRFSQEANSINRVFIGHGHSSAWLSLKAFLADELSLVWDEFNRDSPTGYTTIDRLSDMLDRAKMAFLVMTAEDEVQGGCQAPAFKRYS